MNTDKKIREVKQHIRGMGVQPAVIDAVDMLCEIIEELIDVQVRLLDMQKEVSVSIDTSKVPETKLPITENTGSVKANKTIKTSKIEGETDMSNDEKPIVVDSSIESAVKAIKKEKKKKKETLENIFSDNKTGRYSGPIDS